jgi:hypothetical protein
VVVPLDPPRARGGLGKLAVADGAVTGSTRIMRLRAQIHLSPSLWRSWSLRVGGEEAVVKIEKSLSVALKAERFDFQ